TFTAMSTDLLLSDLPAAGQAPRGTTSMDRGSDSLVGALTGCGGTTESSVFLLAVPLLYLWRPVLGAWTVLRGK
ncbi:MAG TPA: hypothetical protein VFM45_02525, partial [Anaeromyxobacteraceae bacterium]|nr:hypothetical protein [Anaeromyxobacteraceae bacterium]